MKHRANHSTLTDDGPLPSHEAVQINLGIDFGTRFTKVCYRHLGTEESSFLQVDRNGHPRSFLPSVVNISDNEALTVNFNGDRPSSERLERYLKMRLVRPDGDTRESNHSFHRVQALSAFYISRVIDYAKCAYRVEHSQKAEWSANVGVPVSHFDSPHVDVFRRVCAVAWCWADQDIIPSSVSDAMYQYAESLREVSIESSDCHAVPELAGAILSFVTGRGAQPGPYIYFDVGGGTVDGVAFRFDNSQGERKISCYSSAIANLGVDGLVRRFPTSEQGAVRKILVREKRPSPESYKKLSDLKQPLQKLVAEVVYNGKRKDPQPWRQEQLVRLPQAHIIRRDTLPLTVFLGGGGSRSGWYRDIIYRAHGEHQQASYGIPGYRLTPLPIPSDLSMTAAQKSRFDRLAVAYGLSVPAGEGPDFLGPHLFHGPLPPTYVDIEDVIPFDLNHSIFE